MEVLQADKCIKQYGQCPAVELERFRKVGNRCTVGAFKNMRGKIKFCCRNQNGGFLKSHASNPKSVKSIE